MQKIIEFSPIIIVILVIALLFTFVGIASNNNSDQTIITSSALTEILTVSNLSTAKYIHNGIARATIDGKFDGYVMYYALVRPNIDLSKINFEIVEDSKIVKVTIPQQFTFEVELLTEKGFHTSPKNNTLTAKDVLYICEKDAQDKAQAHAELMRVARENLENSLTALLSPLLSSAGYTIVFE